MEKEIELILTINSREDAKEILFQMLMKDELKVTGVKSINGVYQICYIKSFKFPLNHLAKDGQRTKFLNGLVECEVHEN